MANEQKKQNNNQIEKTPDEQFQIRLNKLNELREEGKDPFVITKYDVSAHASEIKENFEAFEGHNVCIAGRLMQKRVMGKASFCNVKDKTGVMQ